MPVFTWFFETNVFIFRHLFSQNNKELKNFYWKKIIFNLCDKWRLFVKFSVPKMLIFIKICLKLSKTWHWKSKFHENSYFSLIGIADFRQVFGNCKKILHVDCLKLCLQLKIIQFYWECNFGVFFARLRACKKALESHALCVWNIFTLKANFFDFF